MTVYIQQMSTPAGRLHLVGEEHALVAVVFDPQWDRVRGLYADAQNTETPVLREAKRQLSEYFRGERKEFDLPYRLDGTPFQVKVWQALHTIPFGSTSTYSQQALAIAAPKAVRAVGRTNGLNRLCIIVPCHRVVGSNGSLTGYAGGLEVKKFLLELERGA